MVWMTTDVVTPCIFGRLALRPPEATLGRGQTFEGMQTINYHTTLLRAILFGQCMGQ